MQITRKNQIADLFKHYFESHGFHPNKALRASNASCSAAATQAALPDTYAEKENTKTEADKKKNRTRRRPKGKEKPTQLAPSMSRLSPPVSIDAPPLSASSRSFEQVKEEGNLRKSLDDY